MDDELISVAQAAKLLNLGTAQVRRFDERLAPTRVAGQRLYLKSVVEGFRIERELGARGDR